MRAASNRQIRMVSLIELRRDVAAALDRVRGELPGPEPDTQMAASLTLGLAVDVAQASTVLDDAFERVNGTPVLLQRARRAQPPGARPGLEPRLGRRQPVRQGSNGLTALVFAGDAPDPSGAPRVPAGGVILLGAEQPAALLQSIAGLLPIGLPTTLNPGDAPVVVGGGVGLPLAPIHVALGERALGFAAGGHAAELVELLAATPTAEPPLLYLDMRVREVATLFGSTRADPPDPALAEIDQDLAGKLAEIDGRAMDRFEELAVRASPTARGLELAIEARYAR